MPSDDGGAAPTGPGGGPGEDLERTVSVTPGGATRRRPSERAVPPAIGDFRILGVLGEGGMGVVYEAEQRKPHRRVALKVMRRGHRVDELHARLFQREAETLARLKPPDVAAIYRSDHTRDGHDFFAMELVSGPTLDAWLADRPTPVTPAELELRGDLEAVGL